ncbi:hypothetical protein BB560_000275 [Smittium megazygosporum]|uniref:Acyl-CoA thioesterase II n=1 Tax=Smittium megazygosporum TaxID=133381 RepID=A0A2T9ZKT2_9FUNG|nr:hypothetical protein BB560_000275 [Smittium megazygosporum]
MDSVSSQLERCFFVKKSDSETADFVSSKNWNFGGKRGLFGGQVISQTVTAAILSVPTDFHINSLHAYFILPANYNKLLSFKVDKIRDGRSFATRLVHAKQDDDEIFTMLCSFQKASPFVSQHQFQIPSVYPPEYSDEQSSIDSSVNYRHSNPPIIKIFNEFICHTRIPVPKDPSLRAAMQNVDKTHIKPPNADPLPNINPPFLMRWIKVDLPSSLISINVSKAFLSLVSDFFLTQTNSLPYLYGYNNGKIKLPMAVSLDHSIYFHSNDFAINEWLLFVLESPRLANNRGFITAKFFTIDGQHVASVAQENVYRTSIVDPESAIPTHVFTPPSLHHSPVSATSSSTATTNTKYKL